MLKSAAKYGCGMHNATVFSSETLDGDEATGLDPHRQRIGAYVQARPVPHKLLCR
jgi:hypothetical protein